jgi:hypothetical protein
MHFHCANDLRRRWTMDTLIGTTLDNTYHIDKLLGQGGTDAVYKAYDTTLNWDVAVKVKSFTADPSTMEKARRARCA